MPTIPPEYDKSLNADPLGDDALQDYMSSLFFGGEVFDGDSVGAKSPSEKPVPAVAEPVFTKAIPNDDSVPNPIRDQVECEEWENRISSDVSLQTTVDKPKPAAALPITHLQPQAQIVSRPQSQRLEAEQVPSDIPLSEEQKKGLQKLLDQKLLMAPEAFADKEPILDDIEVQSRPKLVDQVPAVVNVESVEPQVIADSIDGGPPPPTDVQDEVLEHREAEPKVVLNYREHWNNELPDWGQAKFDALLFSARGVTLAIPLIALGHIYLQSNPLNKVPGLPSWVIGVKPLAQGQLRVIDAGAFFMPERPNRLNTDADLHLLALADSQWAFAVDSVASPISISVDDVQWRRLSNTSPWLAGAIKQHMCVLIDTPALLKLLAR